MGTIETDSKQQRYLTRVAKAKKTRMCGR